MSENREARIAANEAVFRMVNEKIEDVNVAFATISDSFTIVCECGDIGCDRQLDVRTRAYEDVRADPTLFLVVPGHEIADVEDVVAHYDGYDVVRKRSGGRAAAIVAATDPRA